MRTDEISIEAYAELNRSRPVSTEDITCDPDYRIAFLELVRRQAPDAKEAETLKRLSYLRKSGLLPRFQRIKASSK